MHPAQCRAVLCSPCVRVWLMPNSTTQPTAAAAAAAAGPLHTVLLSHMLVLHRTLPLTVQRMHSHNRLIGLRVLRDHVHVHVLLDHLLRRH